MAKASREFPGVTGTNNSMLNQSPQFDLRALSRSKTPVKFLLLSPELFKLLFFELVKAPSCPFLHSLFGLFYPFGIVLAIFKVDLELTDTISPMIRVAQEGFRQGRDFIIFTGVWMRMYMIWKQIKNLLLFFFIQDIPRFGACEQFLCYHVGSAT